MSETKEASDPSEVSLPEGSLPLTNPPVAMAGTALMGAGMLSQGVWATMGGIAGIMNAANAKGEFYSQLAAQRGTFAAQQLTAERKLGEGFGELVLGQVQKMDDQEASIFQSIMNNYQRAIMTRSEGYYRDSLQDRQAANVLYNNAHSSQLLDQRVYRDYYEAMAQNAGRERENAMRYAMADLAGRTSANVTQRNAQFLGDENARLYMTSNYRIRADVDYRKNRLANSYALAARRMLDGSRLAYNAQVMQSANDRYNREAGGRRLAMEEEMFKEELASRRQMRQLRQKVLGNMYGGAGVAAAKNVAADQNALASVHDIATQHGESVSHLTNGQFQNWVTEGSATLRRDRDVTSAHAIAAMGGGGGGDLQSLAGAKTPSGGTIDMTELPNHGRSVAQTQLGPSKNVIPMQDMRHRVQYTTELNPPTAFHPRHPGPYKPGKVPYTSISTRANPNNPQLQWMDERGGVAPDILPTARPTKQAA